MSLAPASGRAVPFNLANLITASRIVLAPVMLILAWRGMEHAFLACFVVSLASDIVDGKVARRLNLASELGSRLDSWADMLTYAMAPVALYWLRPDLVAAEKPWFFTGVACYAVPISIGFLKFRGLTAYHSFLARVSAYALGTSAILLFAHGPTLPFRVAVCILLVAELEEVAITIALPKPRSNVRSFRAALAIRRAMRGTSRSAPAGSG